MIETFYICQLCNRRSSSMEILDNKAEPTEKQKVEHRPVANERLICPCGKIHTWWTLQKLSTM